VAILKENPKWRRNGRRRWSRKNSFAVFGFFFKIATNLFKSIKHHISKILAVLFEKCL
jgi:hypothetical protein